MLLTICRCNSANNDRMRQNSNYYHTCNAAPHATSPDNPHSHIPTPTQPSSIELEAKLSALQRSRACSAQAHDHTKSLINPPRVTSLLNLTSSYTHSISLCDGIARITFHTPKMNNPNNNAQGAGQQDYLDKAFAAGAKKFGGAQGQKVANNRAMSEKIVRSYFPNTSVARLGACWTTTSRPRLCAQA